MTIEFHPDSEPLPWDVWVLGYWPHMDRPSERHHKRWLNYAGWYPTKRREWGWTIWSRSYKWRMKHGPAYWTPILEPLPDQEIGPSDEASVIMSLRFGGAVINCPSCGITSQFHRVRKRRVFACSHCLFQISPTANTIMHDTRTPLAKWSCAAELIGDNPRITARELQRRLDVTYKCAWRIRSKLRASVDTLPKGEDRADGLRAEQG